MLAFPGTANIFRKMVGLPEATSNKEEDDKSYLHSSSTNAHQQHHSKQRTISDFMTKNSLSITISFIAYTSSVKVCNGSR
jgi:hypothetical protein